MRSRGYRQGDVEAMYLLDLACFDGAFQFDRNTMLEVAETPSAIIVIIEDDAAEEMLGFIIVHTEGKRTRRFGYIITIDVAPSARRLGVGAAMLQEAEKQARRFRLKRIALHVAVDNAGAIAFYEREQYERAGVVKGFYHEAKQDALLYSKTL